MHLSFYIAALFTCTICMSVTRSDKQSSQQPVADTTLSALKPAELINASYKKAYTLADINYVLDQRQPARIQMGYTRQGRMIQAWYFPGISEHRALVIGGVHGSELSSIEVANELISQLLQGNQQPFYTVVVIPSLFPDNAAEAANYPDEAGSVKNIGRYSNPEAVDPNRQMPSPGKAFDEAQPIDHLDRIIEKENQLLLQLIQAFQPQRIANLHAIRNTGYGGIYADPRTDHLGLALGYASDSSLAVDMAKYVQRNGGNVGGNQLNKKPTALYYKDPTPVAPGHFQRRNMSGSSLKAHRGSGVSMGTWGTTAIAGQAQNRAAMRVLTIEFPGAKRPEDYPTAAQRSFFKEQVGVFAKSILNIFLQNNYPEENDLMI